MDNNQLQRCAPEALGISSSGILAFIESLEKNICEPHSFMLLRHGKVAAEGWWAPYRSESRQMLFSLSKSFTATAVGIAAAEGLLSLDDLVLPLFPDEAPANPDPRLEKLSIRHLLTMSSGHAGETMIVAPSNAVRIGLRSDGQWVRGFLETELQYEPGTHFAYNSGATYMLSAIVQKLSGAKLCDYLKLRLFDPLGMLDPTWETSPEGINCGGWGLSIRTEDLARFGQLYLQKGVWEGQRILPAAWVEGASSCQIATGHSPDGDRGQGYGYQFWRCRHGAFRGEGGFGQFCLVMPEQDAVLAVTAAVQGDMWALLDEVWDHLLPVIDVAPLPPNPAEQANLERRLEGLSLPPPKGQGVSPLASSVSGKTYRMDPNLFGIEAVNIDFTAVGATVRLNTAAGEMAIACGSSAWLEGKMGASGLGAQPILASGAWMAEDTFVLTVRYYETPFYDIHTFQFEQDNLLLSSGINIALRTREYPPVRGRLQEI